MAAFNCPLIRMFPNKQLSCVFHGAHARNTDSLVCTLSRTLDFHQYITNNSNDYNSDLYLLKVRN